MPDSPLVDEPKRKHYGVSQVNHSAGDVQGQGGIRPPFGGLKRGLKSRHVQMIALGGTIGTGLFVGSGQSLSIGGPLFLLLAYIIISVLLYGVATGLTEMASYLPVDGCSVPYFAHRFVSPSLSFTLGWLYWYCFAIGVPTEMTAAGLVVSYWHPPVNVGVWITIFGSVVVGLNCMPVRYYGEAEFWFASLKVITILALFVVTIVLFFGGGPSGQPLYFSNWNRPAPINEYLTAGPIGHLCAFTSTLCYSIFAFVFAPELIVQTAGEMQSPRQNLPIAGRHYMYRLIIFYVLGTLCIGILVSSGNPSLLRGGSGSGSSPWSLGIRAAGIRGLDSVINGAILLSAWSGGNAGLYLATRSLYSMALSGNAPEIFARCSRSGVPYYALVASAAWIPLAYLNVSTSGGSVFGWLVNITNTGGFQSWVCCCFIYIRFRKAADAQNISDVPYRSKFQPLASWLSGGILLLLLLLNGYEVFISGYWSASSFVTSYIGLPIFAALYFGHRLTVGRHDAWARKFAEVDLVSGLEEILAIESPRTKGKKRWFMAWTKIYD